MSDALDKKLDTILEKLAISKLDNSFLLSFSVLSILFTLSTTLLTDELFKRIFVLGAILYFVISFYIGYFKGAIRDNWGFRIWGWVLALYSTAVILTALLGLMLVQSGVSFPTLSLYGIAIILVSIVSFWLIGFIKEICKTTPAIKNHIRSMSFLHLHFLSPFVGPAIDERSSKTTYLAFFTILIIGIILGIY